MVTPLYIIALDGEEPITADDLPPVLCADRGADGLLRPITPPPIFCHLDRAHFPADRMAWMLRDAIVPDRSPAMGRPSLLVSALAASSAILLLASTGLSIHALSQGGALEAAMAEADQASDFADHMLLYMAENLPDTVQPTVLADLGARAIALFGTSAPNALSDEELTRRARILHFIAEARDVNGDIDGAQEAYQLAHTLTGDALARAPQSEPRRFAHSQSAFWVGASAYRRGQLEQAEEAFQTYADLVQGLAVEFPTNLSYQAESGHAAVNLAAVHLERGESEQAEAALETAVARFQSEVLEVGAASPSDLANALAWLADVRIAQGAFAEAIEARAQTAAIYQTRLDQHPDDAGVSIRLADTLYEIGAVQLMTGQQAAAAQSFEAGLEHITQARRAVPDNVRARRIYTSLVVARAGSLRREGRLDLAKLLIDEARARLLEDMTGALDERYEEAADLAEEAARIALAFTMLERAQMEATTAIQAWERHIEAGHQEDQSALAEARLLLAEIMDGLDRPGEAQREIRRAAQALEHAQSPPWRVSDLRARLAWLQGQTDRARSEAEALSAQGYAHPEFTRFWRAADASGVAEILPQEDQSNDG